jgi:hypothetical protein
MELRESAIFHAQLGFSVFQLRYLDNTPRLRNWLQQATSDPVIASQRWARYPYANIGTRTCHGPLNSCVIDVDVKHGAKLRDLAQRFRLTRSWMTITPNGGHHIFYRCIDYTPHGYCGRIWPAVDLRGWHNLVPLPPSRRKRLDGSVGEYRWAEGCAPGQIPLASLPRLVVEALQEYEEIKRQKSSFPQSPAPDKSSSAYASRRLQGIIGRVLSAPEHEGNSMLYWASCRCREMVREGILSRSEAIATLIEAATRYGRRSEDEARRTVASGMGA